MDEYSVCDSLKTPEEAETSSNEADRTIDLLCNAVYLLLECGFACLLRLSTRCGGLVDEDASLSSRGQRHAMSKVPLSSPVPLSESMKGS